MAAATFDAYGRTVMQTRMLNSQPITTTSVYDQLGRLIGMQDAIGIQWGWAFDSLSRNTAKADPDAGTWTFAYDPAGRLISQTDAKFQTTTFDYDSVGRLTTRDDTGSGSGDDVLQRYAQRLLQRRPPDHDHEPGQRSEAGLRCRGTAGEADADARLDGLRRDADV